MIINIVKSLSIIFIFLFSPSAFALEKVSLQLQWKYQFQFAGYIIAKEKGFYKDYGLEVELKEWSIKEVLLLYRDLALFLILKL